MILNTVCWCRKRNLLLCTSQMKNSIAKLDIARESRAKLVMTLLARQLIVCFHKINVDKRGSWLCSTEDRWSAWTSYLFWDSLHFPDEVVTKSRPKGTKSCRDVSSEEVAEEDRHDGWAGTEAEYNGESSNEYGWTNISDVWYSRLTGKTSETSPYGDWLQVYLFFL